MKAAQTAAPTQGQTAHAEPITMRKRIGSTLYRVNIHFSESSTETMDDKILRLIKRDIESGKRAGL
jgi:hypothetical protein